MSSKIKRVYALVRPMAWGEGVPVRLVHRVFESKKDAEKALAKILSDDDKGRDHWIIERVKFREHD